MSEIKFRHLFPSGKIFLAIPGKIHHWPSLGKNHSDDLVGRVAFCCS